MGFVSECWEKVCREREGRKKEEEEGEEEEKEHLLLLIHLTTCASVKPSRTNSS